MKAFAKELAIRQEALDVLECTEKQVMVRFRLEVMNMIAKYRRYDYSFKCGNGTFFFCKGNDIVHDENKLPPEMKALCEFLEEHYYIQGYLYEINKGVVSMRLENNPHLKEVEKILNDWDESKGYLTTNDIHGVDLVAPIDLKELGIEGTDEELIHLLEMHYDGSDYYFRHNKDDYHEVALVASSCEEIFVTFENELCFPDGDTKSIKLSSEDKEIEIIAYSLEWMHDKGMFPAIYQLDYYGNSPTLYKYQETNEYKELKLSEDDKKQYEEVSRLVEIIEFKKRLNETTQSLGELPSKFYEALPKELQEQDGNCEVFTVESFDAYTMRIEFETDDLEGEEMEGIHELVKKGTITYGQNNMTFWITISLLPNSVRFLKGLDNTLSLEVS